LPVHTVGFGDWGNGGGEEEETAAVVLGVGRLGTRRRAKEWSSECGVERRGGVHFIGPGRRWGGGEEADDGGVLIPISFEGVKVGRGDGTPLIQWGK
jgi:hypothetical protein